MFVLDGVSVGEVAAWPWNIIVRDVVVPDFGVGKEGGLTSFKWGAFPLVGVLFFVVPWAWLIFLWHAHLSTFSLLIPIRDFFQFDRLFSSDSIEN